MIAKFTGHLLEYAPHVKEIGRCVGFFIGDRVVSEGEDHTISLRIVLYPSKTLLNLSLFQIILEKNIYTASFHLGIPGHCFMYSRKGQLLLCVSDV